MFWVASVLLLVFVVGVFSLVAVLVRIAEALEKIGAPVSKPDQVAQTIAAHLTIARAQADRREPWIPAP